MNFFQKQLQNCLVQYYIDILMFTQKNSYYYSTVKAKKVFESGTQKEA